MKRALLCLSATVFAALLTASSLQSAQTARPRFLVTIKGTQHWEWTLDRNDSCSIKAQGEQRETFGTARPVKVIPPPTYNARTNEFQALSSRGWGRLVPLSGRETRVYRVLRPPTGDCRPHNLAPEYRSNCDGANALHPRAGVVLMRVRQTLALHVPVATTWIPRRPSACAVGLFDLRNFYTAAVFGLRVYRPVQGGTFENRRTKTLRWNVSVRYCAGGYENDFELRECDRPPPARSALTGTLTASWSATFRRATS
jgi:hypothetical protein